ncbi:PA domain-containing protein [Oricola sp.]|uniref:PA domain-containing protein n=1 Tax=Oricola sp. TaxID=1979950 RepID=UPI003BAB16AA
MKNPLSEEALLSDIVRFAELGDHRTASMADLATSEWVKTELEKVGLAAELDPWPLRQFQNLNCRLRVFGKQCDTFPLWYPRSTGSEPIVARLVQGDNHGDLRGAIALVQFPDVMVTEKSAHARMIHALAEAGARAVVGCTPHVSGEIYGQNVIPPHNQTPWPLPVLMIAPSDWHVFEAAARLGSSVEFLLDGVDCADLCANNVVAYRERGDRWIIVSTPQSGWFRSAGERGAGLALLLGLARWMALAETDHSLLFLSNSGHEIGHLGAFHALSNPRLPKPGQCDCWLHLGSCIATHDFDRNNHLLVPASPPDPSWLFASQDLIEPLSHSFSDLTHLTPELYNRDHGEIRWILERGYSAFSLMGAQQFFHLKGDGPEVVNGRLIEKVGAALKNTLGNIMARKASIPFAS